MGKKHRHFDEEAEQGKPRPKEKFQEREKRFKINYTPLTPNQRHYWHALNNDTIIIAHGSAGTGKTCTAVTWAMKEIANGFYEKLILCRANVPTGRTLGAFPGTIEEKLGPWLSNVVGYCKELVGTGTVNTWMRGEFPKIVMTPIETIRGQSFSNSIILVEEAQQLTFEELKCITTRLGKNSKMILTGDPNQRDTIASGLEEFIAITRKYGINSISDIKFTPDDIVRSDIVRDLIICFEKEGV